MAMMQYHRTLVTPRAGQCWTGRLCTRSAAASLAWTRANSITTARPSFKHAKLLHLGAGAFTGRRSVPVANRASSLPGFSATPHDDSDDGLNPRDNISVAAVKESVV